MAYCISYHICSESRHDAAGGIARTVGAGICRARRCGPLDPSRPPAAPAIAHLIWAECVRACACACCCGCAVRGSRRCVREQARSMCARVALALVIPQKYVAACMLYAARRFMLHVVCCTVQAAQRVGECGALCTRTWAFPTDPPRPKCHSAACGTCPALTYISQPRRTCAAPCSAASHHLAPCSTSSIRQLAASPVCVAPSPR
jgi:hypothetical protein